MWWPRGRRGCNALQEPIEKHGRAMPREVERLVVRDQETGKGQSPHCSFGYVKGLLLKEKPLEGAGTVHQKHPPIPLLYPSIPFWVIESVLEGGRSGKTWFGRINLSPDSNE